MNFRIIKLFLLLCICAFLTDSCFSQTDENWSPVSKKNAISINIAGTTPLIGVTYERLISNKFTAEIGLGIYSIGVAIKYFPFSIYDNKMVFHSALGTNLFATPFDTFGSGDFSSINYLTIGLTYFGKEGFGFALDIGFRGAHYLLSRW